MDNRSLVGSAAGLRQQIRNYRGGLVFLALYMAIRFRPEIVSALTSWRYPGLARPLGLALSVGTIGALLLGASSRRRGLGMVAGLCLLAVSFIEAAFVTVVALGASAPLDPWQLFRFAAWVAFLVIGLVALLRLRYFLRILEL